MLEFWEGPGTVLEFLGGWGVARGQRGSCSLRPEAVTGHAVNHAVTGHAVNHAVTGHAVSDPAAEGRSWSNIYVYIYIYKCG